LSRERLEELCEDLVQRTLKICQQTLEEAGLTAADVDEVILVGGMTRMPRVQQQVAAFFDRDPSKNVHPDEVVALGAAIQGHALMDERPDVLLLDVTPHNLGIGVYGGGFQVLIEKNSTVPTARSHIFTTVKDNQTSVKIIVLQGEGTLAKENELLGEFILHGLRQAPAGEVEIEINFEISADGIVSVSARDLETGLEQSITVTATSGLTEDEIQNMIDENKDYLVQVQQSEELETHRANVRRTIRQVEKLLPTVQEVMEGSTLGKDALRKAQDALERAKEALEGRNVEHLVSTGEALNRTYAVFQGIVQRMQ
jgi:molecular chaperone DnaK